MTSVRSFDYLHCANCQDTTLHASNVCQTTGCGHISRASGNKPVPRERAYGYATMKPQNYNARAEQASARARARKVRATAMRGRA